MLAGVLAWMMTTEPWWAMLGAVSGVVIEWRAGSVFSLRVALRNALQGFWRPGVLVTRATATLVLTCLVFIAASYLGTMML